MYLNPIVKKDVKVQSRSMKICWGVFAYELILTLVFFLAMNVIQSASRYSTNNIYSFVVWLYPTLAVTQLIVLGMVVPVRTASSISGEKERQTFDIMMTTGMSPFSIIVGKVMTAIVQSMLFVVASMPIMALSFIIGGMSWAYLFWFLAIALLVSLFAASIGILCSSLCKKSIGAVIMSYAFYMVFFLGTVIPSVVYEVIMEELRFSGTVASGTLQIYDSYGKNFYLSLLLNPALYLTEFFGQVMTGESLVGSIGDLTGSVRVRGPIGFLIKGHNWLIFSTVLFMGISVLFLWIASKRIDPIKNRNKRKAVNPPGMPRGTGPVPQGAAPVPQGTGPVPQGAAPMPQATGPVTQGAAPVPQGTGPVPQGAAPVPQATGPVSQGAAPVPQATGPVSQGAPRQLPAESSGSGSFCGSQEKKE